ncbi:MAG: uroporphyrinogen-III synthase [Flavobacterium sp.]|nr:MAG: uroporphyrinogen-III synthase [Flavobacterium sp.]
MKTFRILSTKKLQPNQRQFLLNAGISVIEADFISIRLKEFELPVIGESLIFTSANAVKSVLQNSKLEELRRRPCICVGSKTRTMLEENGFTVVESEENADELGKKIRENHRGKSFTFFAGNLRLETLPDLLKGLEIFFNEVQVYETTLEPQKVQTATDAILFFSPSGVVSYLKSNSIASQFCFCIGETTAKALEAETKNIVVSNKSTVENVIIQCINHFNKQT